VPILEYKHFEHEKYDLSQMMLPAEDFLKEGGGEAKYNFGPARNRNIHTLPEDRITTMHILECRAPAVQRSTLAIPVRPHPDTAELEQYGRKKVIPCQDRKQFVHQTQYSDVTFQKGLGTAVMVRKGDKPTDEKKKKKDDFVFKTWRQVRPAHG
jgi:hypothetical protein